MGVQMRCEIADDGLSHTAETLISRPIVHAATIGEILAMENYL